MTFFFQRFVVDLYPGSIKDVFSVSKGFQGCWPSGRYRNNVDYLNFNIKKSIFFINQIAARARKVQKFTTDDFQCPKFVHINRIRLTILCKNTPAKIPSCTVWWDHGLTLTTNNLSCSPFFGMFLQEVEPNRYQHHPVFVCVSERVCNKGRNNARSKSNFGEVIWRAAWENC